MLKGGSGWVRWLRWEEDGCRGARVNPVDSKGGEEGGRDQDLKSGKCAWNWRPPNQGCWTSVASGADCDR